MKKVMGIVRGAIALSLCVWLSACDVPAPGACSETVCDSDHGSGCEVTCASDISQSRCAQIYGDFHEGKTCEDIGLSSSCSPLIIFFPGSECI